MITFVLLNPSTADAVQLDPTLRRQLRVALRVHPQRLSTALPTVRISERHAAVGLGNVCSCKRCH